jgi:hypothetical protein
VEPDPIPRNSSCTPSLPDLDAGGTWRMSGTVTYDRCDLHSGIVEERPYPFTSRPFTVVQQGRALLAGAGSTLTLTESQVQGNCVTLRVTDADPAGETASYDLSGIAQAGDGARAERITGTFTGAGPRGCESSGTFQIDVE